MARLPDDHDERVAVVRAGYERIRAEVDCDALASSAPFCYDDLIAQIAKQRFYPKIREWQNAIHDENDHARVVIVPRAIAKEVVEYMLCLRGPVPGKYCVYLARDLDTYVGKIRAFAIADFSDEDDPEAVAEIQFNDLPDSPLNWADADDLIAMYRYGTLAEVIWDQVYESGGITVVVEGHPQYEEIRAWAATGFAPWAPMEDGARPRPGAADDQNEEE